MEDGASPLVFSTYKLEGDDFLAPIAYDILEEVRNKGKIVTGRNGQNAVAPQVF